MSKKASIRIDRMEDSDFESLLIWTNINPALQDLHDALAIVGYTGLRLREFTRLRWADVDFERRRLTVPDQRRWRRSVPFAEKTNAVLRSRRDRHPDAEFVFGPEPSKIGRRLGNQLRVAGKSFDIHPCTFHALRARSIYRVMAAGDSLRTALYIFGYSDPSHSHGEPTKEGMFETAARLIATLEYPTPAHLPLLPISAEDVEAYFDRIDEIFENEMPTDFERGGEWIREKCNSYLKIPALLHLHGQIAFGDWLTLLGEFWTGSDNIGRHKDDLVEIFREWLDTPEGIIPELMDEEERAIYDALPDEVTIYRGCGPLNKDGFSWSLDRDAAAWFPFSGRSGTQQPVLLTATIPKTRVAAAKLRGSESEIIVIGLPESAWTEEVLTEPPPTGHQCAAQTSE